MGFLDKLRTHYDLQKVEQYTKRREAQSPFEFHDRDYYQSVYQEGVYLDPHSSSRRSSSSSLSSIGWGTVSKLVKKRRGLSLATEQIKTSESYSSRPSC
ncbi:hypothetical protein J3Q64DRAFT_1712298 [Phycomyces blakesleeanus]|uniref:Uncharacterized protein n=1 Tax=Phycomyces blakesleeanus TaxID=4837 RepID=A0ABR3BFD3_PHYBL